MNQISVSTVVLCAGRATLIGWPALGDEYCNVGRRRSWTWIKLAPPACRRRARPGPWPRHFTLLASGLSSPAGLATPPLTGTRTRRRAPQAPAGHVAGAMDALGRVTEGQSPRPDPNLAPAYLALMPLRASAVRVRRGAHHAHPQGMQGTPPERLHHRRSRRGRALSVNQPPRGIGSQSLSGTPTVGPRPGAGPGIGRCT